MFSRLLINPYTLWALVACFVGMAGYAGYYQLKASRLETGLAKAEGEVERLATERNTVIEISKQKDKEIDRLVRQSEINNKIMTDIHFELRSIEQASQVANEKLTELENSNATVKVFLDTALPDDLKRLLNRK